MSELPGVVRRSADGEPVYGEHEIAASTRCEPSEAVAEAQPCDTCEHEPACVDAYRGSRRGCYRYDERLASQQPPTITDEAVAEAMGLVDVAAEALGGELQVRVEAALATLTARLADYERLREERDALREDNMVVRADAHAAVWDDPSEVRVPRAVLEENSDIVGGGGYGTGWSNFARHLLREYGSPTHDTQEDHHE